MKIFLIFIVFNIALSSVNAQGNIKKIIYDDLLTLNDLYDGCLIQFEQYKILIKDKDTIKDFKTIDEIRNDFEKRVRVINLDSLNGYYFVDVKFDLIANARFPFLFSDNSFTYVLYNRDDKLIKINGFLISEILFTNDLASTIREVARIKAPKKFIKYLIRQNTDKIKNYLTISVLEKIYQSGYYMNYRPYVKEFFCY